MAQSTAILQARLVDATGSPLATRFDNGEVVLRVVNDEARQLLGTIVLQLSTFTKKLQDLIEKGD